jgi:hypothetical protein
MKILGLVLAWIVLMNYSARAESTPDAERFETLKAPLADSQVQKCLACIYQQGHWGFDTVEYALFLQVFPPPKGYQCSLWPSKFESRKSEYTGFFPPRSIAIMHTHPAQSAVGNEISPKPEGGDIVTAKKLRVPNYVISQKGVWVYDPFSQQHYFVADKTWLKTIPVEDGKVCTGLPIANPKKLD